MQFNLIFLGHFGDASMVAGVGLGSVTLNIMCLSMLYGMNGAIETLVAQAFGMKDLTLCGQYLNRGRVILTLVFIPFMILLLFTEKILIGIGQDPTTSKYAH